MASCQSTEKRALLISPTYPGLPGSQLPGTSNDLQTMKNLTTKLKFNDVKEIVGGNATKENILKALDELSSVAVSSSIVLIHFSGHGCYLTSTKDEGLVPADVTTEKLKNEDKDAFITGVDLLPYLERLSKNCATLTMIFDCCHSGQLYRVADFKNSGSKDIRARQILIKQSSTSESPSTVKSVKPEKKLLRGGWTPKENDSFFFIAACSPMQLAYEDVESGGRLTMAIDKVVNNLQSFENVSIQAFFRLIEREFKENGWNELQTPQLEGASLETELFGVNKVPSKKGIPVNDVNGGEVILDAGCLQNILPGEYSVFETTVTQAGVDLGNKSSDWLGNIDVTGGRIGRIQTSGFVVKLNDDPHKKISHGCLAYLTTPTDVKTNVLVKLTADSAVSEEKVKDLLKHINNTNIINASTEPLKIKDADAITIGIESCDPSDPKKEFWVARKRGDVIVPPISLGSEETMAGNLSRYVRYKIALDSAQPPKKHEELLDNITVKILKLEKVKPFPNAAVREKRIQEGLENGKDVYENASQYPSFRSHSLKDPRMNKLNDETGDAFLFQVTNSSENKEETVHICVLFYQFDGAIKKLYPHKKGKTVEVRGGDTAEDIFRVFIPYNSLRTMAQPDLTKPEGDRGIDTIVVYATSKPADFEPLLQTAIETDPRLTPRGREEKAQILSDLAKFTLSIRKRNAEDHPDEDFKCNIIKREFAVIKNNN